MSSCSSWAVCIAFFSAFRLSLVISSVLALRTSSIDGARVVGTGTDGVGIGDVGLGKEEGNELGMTECGETGDAGMCGAPGANCSRNEMPVPGIEAVP